MNKIAGEFKAFIMRGNVLDMAVGIVIGLAFGKIITSLVNDVIMPPIGYMLGGLNFSDLYVNLSGITYESLGAAVTAGAPVIKYGMFINTIVDFLIIAVVIFFIVRFINKLQKPPKPAEVTTKDCPFCFTAISLKATRCPNCTSELGK
jgi:large conductance mechanosensitive channel